MRPSLYRLAAPFVLILGSTAAPLLAAFASAAAEPPVVENPATPPGGVERLAPVELFRLGGEDDEIFFGSVPSIDTDAAGNLYVLDSQQNEVQVYSPAGEHLRTLGREGDGPGEIRNPNYMFLADDGTVCVLQGFPGRITRIAPDGTPAGQAAHSLDGTPGQFNALIAGHGYPGGMLLSGIRMTFTGPGQSDNTSFIDRCDPTGMRRINFFEKTAQTNYAALVMDEGVGDFPIFRQAVLADGAVAIAIPRNRYEITVFDADGAVERVIRRRYDSVRRSAGETETARRLQAAIGANYPTPVQEIRVEETEADIDGLFAAKDGRLWVATSRGARETPDGCWIVLDVFARDGRFEKQVALVGAHDARRDGLVLLPDGRALVITGSLDAWLSRMGTVPDESGDESDPLEITCYRIFE